MDFSKFNRFSTRQIAFFITALLALFVFFGALGVLGQVGRGFASINFWLFGYFGYIWLFGVAYLLYAIKKPIKLDSIPLEQTLGYLLSAFALLILQALFFSDAGILGVAFNSVLEPIISPLGIFILVLAMGVMASVLISGKSLKALLKMLFKDLKQDVKDLNKESKTLKKRNLELLQKIKAFFTPIKKESPKITKKQEDSQEIMHKAKSIDKAEELSKSEDSVAIEMTLEELLEKNPKLQEEAREIQKYTQQRYLNEEEYETQDLKEETIKGNDGFYESIDGIRQGVELHTWQKLEENAQEEMLNKEEGIIIKRVSSSDIPLENHDVEQFQMQSMENFKKLRDFDESLYIKSNDFEKKEEDKNIIRLIKSENLPQELQTECIKEEEKQIELPIKEEKKPEKLIKEYPKKLYTATPFSAYFGKDEEQENNLESKQTLKDNENLKENEENNISTQEAISEDLYEEKQKSTQEPIEDIGDIIQQDILEIQKELQPDIEMAENSLHKENLANKIPQAIKSASKEQKENQEIYQQITSNQTQTNLIQPNYLYYSAMDFAKESKKVEVLEVEIPKSENINTESKGDEAEQIEIFSENVNQEMQKENPQEIKEIAQKETLNSKEEINKEEIEKRDEESQKEDSYQGQKIKESITQEESKSPIYVKSLSENEALLKDIEVSENHTIDTKDFVLPPLDFLQEPKSVRVEIDEAEIDKKVADLLSKLRMFKIEGDVVRTYSGPLVTTIEFRPSPNVKVTKITACEADLAMALRAKTIRIQAPIPGKDVVGIEIPNDQVETIYLREILKSDLFKNSISPLTLALGKDITGNPFITDLKKLPHLLIAGTTGSGKSVGINAMILSMLYKNTPETLRLIMIDPKMLEFSMYNDIPHLLTPVITEPKKAIIALDNAVKEMERRYLLMSGSKTKNIENYNQRAEIDGFEKFPYIVIVIDEFADLMMSGGKEAEVSIARLAQKSRACGIHLIVATQRPSVDVVTSIIKSNLPSRISYKVGSKIDSKVVLDEFGAESLLGRGDMLFTPPGGGIVRLHAPWVDENEIEKIVEFLKEQCAVQYDENFMPSEDEVMGLSYDGEVDELYEEAKRIMLNDNKTSISYIQRRLGIGYNKAANIVEQMEAKGFLSAPNAKGIREILSE